MATWEENIQKIRSTAIYGTDIREAIAQGLEQTEGSLDGKIAQYKSEVFGVVNGYTTRLDTIQHDIEVSDLFISVTPIQGNDYLATITGSVG